VNATPSPWLHVARPVAEPRVRLLCFAHAGGSAHAFHGWSAILPGDVEVCAVQLPGRGFRLAEPAHTRMEPLLAALGDVLAPRLDRPYALFGHSLGARIAFELARRLRRVGAPSPVHMFMSGCRAPQLADPAPPLHRLADDALVAELHRRHGAMDDALADPELRALALPGLRADLELLETCTYTPEPPLPAPLTAFGGLDDARVPVHHVAAWTAQTSVAFAMHMLPGDHFFLRGQRDALLATIAGALARG
jgi:medium-chain acyl-[acyl-carrier-protein] hydrolase